VEVCEVCGVEEEGSDDKQEAQEKGKIQALDVKFKRLLMPLRLHSLLFSSLLRIVWYVVGA
jgi:hypothetical protein